MIKIGYKWIEARAAPAKWLSSLLEYRESAMPIGTQLDSIDHALWWTADAARCWEVNPGTYNDRHHTRLVEQSQDAIARAYPPTETTVRLLQQITPDGLTLGHIRCEDCGSPLIAISIDPGPHAAASGLSRDPRRLPGLQFPHPRSCVAAGSEGWPQSEWRFPDVQHGEADTAPAERFGSN